MVSLDVMRRLGGSALDRVLRWWYAAAPKETRVVKVIAFNLSDCHEGFHEYLAWEPAKFAGGAWEQHVLETTGFPDARLEIRLLENGKKRRVVLYPGMTCDPAFPPPPKQIIVTAQLMPRPSETAGEQATPMNVTARVQKYLGNSLRTVHHMFPFDDHQDNAERFSHVRAIDLSFRVSDAPLT